MGVKLYYPVDALDPAGDKTFVGPFASLEEAHAQASQDLRNSYSVEETQLNGSILIIFIC
jgi:hypothetical protein